MTGKRIAPRKPATASTAAPAAPARTPGPLIRGGGKPTTPPLRKCCGTRKQTSHEPNCPQIQPPKPRGPKYPIYGRLPDAAAFALKYRAIDATNGVWTGTLTIGDFTATVEKNALYKTIAALDETYRKHAARQQPGGT